MGAHDLSVRYAQPTLMPSKAVVSDLRRRYKRLIWLSCRMQGVYLLDLVKRQDKKRIVFNHLME